MDSITLYGYRWRNGELSHEAIECFKDGHHYRAMDGQMFTFAGRLRGLVTSKVGKVALDSTIGGYPYIYLPCESRNRAIKRIKEHYNTAYRDAKTKMTSAADQIKALNDMYCEENGIDRD